MTYRVAGKLSEVDELLSRRARLRRRILDELHERGIDIMSPHFHSVLQRRAAESVIPEETGGERQSHRPPEAVAVDKADRAKEITERREALSKMEEKMVELAGRISEAKGEEKEHLEWERARISGERKRLTEELGVLEAELPKEN